MINIHIILMGLIFMTFLRGSHSISRNNNETIIPDGQYFGLKQPGLAPEIFSPEISFFKERKVQNVFFSPDGKTFFIQTIDSFYYLKSKDGHWTQPKLVKIVGIDGKISSLNISPDGKCILFTNKGDIVSCKWQGDSLSMPEKLPEQINSNKYECSSFMSMDHSVYFASQREGSKGKCDIFFSKSRDGKYETPVNLENFNTEGSECGVYVSPKDDFIVFTGFDNRKDGFGSSDLYISFPLKDGSWSTPKNMGTEFNSVNPEWPVTISPDEKYFFFGKYKMSGHILEIYWVNIMALSRFKSR